MVSILYSTQSICIYMITNVKVLTLYYTILVPVNISLFALENGIQSHPKVPEQDD